MKRLLTAIGAAMAIATTTVVAAPAAEAAAPCEVYVYHQSGNNYEAEFTGFGYHGADTYVHIYVPQNGDLSAQGVISGSGTVWFGVRTGTSFKVRWSMTGACDRGSAVGRGTQNVGWVPLTYYDY